MKPSAMQFARVYIQLKTRSLEHTFDYAVPVEMNGAVGAGSVVLVPFGRQKALGLVSELADTTAVPAEKVQQVEAVLDYPPVPQPLIRLALWVSTYYYCSPASALSLVLPPGGLPALSRSKVDGENVYVLKPPRVKPRLERFARLAPSEAESTDDNDESGPGFRRTAARMRVLEALTSEEELSIPRLLELACTGHSTINSLAELGVIEIFQRGVSRDGLRFYGGAEEEKNPPREPLELNSRQQGALAAIISRMDERGRRNRSRPILIEGVPGAGKTEVYLRAIEEAVSHGGKAIVLVPEISLTNQAVKRFRRRFGERVGVLHSGLGLGERYDEYMRIRSGAVDVVVGPRSALFAPVDGLKLIVVDEENDSSFKQENEPRYDARRTALQRARLQGASVVFGSATPSLESYQLIKDRYELPERATGAAMPVVEIVDMREEDNQIFSSRLLAEVDANISSGGKTILLLNSRGYARFIQCVHCGHVWKCGNCEVSLTIHNRIGRLICHHCGHTEGMPDICPVCSSSELRRWGIGTERLEKEVKKLFPEAPVFRLDADTAGGYGEGPRILDDFGRTERAILTGTQMVAKGHHFPEVTLSAVINADLALEFPEFRAEERTFSLLLQLAGRSGRAEFPGKVIIQTWNADIDCIRMAANQELESFYQMELDRRRRLDYPPFTGLINIICLSHDEEKPRQAAAYLKARLEPVLTGEKLLGPATLFRLKGWSRGHVLVKTPDIEGTLSAMRPVIEHYREPFRVRGVRIVVDVDPQWLS